MKGWIGVDLDGTLAHYDGWKGPEHIGEPVPAMVERVKKWLEEGQAVKIFTARVAEQDQEKLTVVIACIEQWSLGHLGVILPITNVKDFGMIQLWDDRCTSVYPNTGRAYYEPPHCCDAVMWNPYNKVIQCHRCGDTKKPY